MRIAAFHLHGRGMVLWAMLPFAFALVATVDVVAPAESGDRRLNTSDTSFPNDPKLPTLSIDDVTVNESDSTATFTITSDGRPNHNAGFDIATTGIDATEGSDYAGQATTLTISANGKTGTRTFTVPIIDDDVNEPTETFLVTLTNPEDATLLKPTGIGSITDNDTAGITVEQFDGVFVIEGGGADTLNTALRSQPTADVVITFAAVADQLIVTPSEVTFDSANWDQEQQISIAAVQDGIDEQDQHTSPISFSVDSADTDYNGLLVPDVVATIGDADSLLVTIDGPAVGAPGGPVTFVAVVNAGGTGPITYDWTVFRLGNPIANGNQATLQFTPQKGGTYIIQTIVGDDKGQNPATFFAFVVLGDIGTSVFTRDIIWLAEQGITRSCNPPDNDLFCPNAPVTRGQMAAFLVRFLGLTNDGGGNTFSDANGSIFENDIAKLATAGITKGCNPPANDNFCPNAPVTREQMAAFIRRADAILNP